MCKGTSVVIFPLYTVIPAVAVDRGNISHAVVKLLELYRVLTPFRNGSPGSSVCHGLRDVIVTYSSLTVFYDPVEVKRKNDIPVSVFTFIQGKLEEACRLAERLEPAAETAIVNIPVCYDEGFGYDLDFISMTNQLSKEEIVNLHISRVYYVYMIGFLPGFSYMAAVDDKLVIERKPNPMPVVAGSVGIAGSQTGIYPLNSPGGWQIIGRTPIKLFDEQSDPPVLLKAGNRVQFYGISREEYDNWQPVKKELPNQP